MSDQDPIEFVEIQEAPKKRIGLWQKLGGGALTFAVIFHVILLIIGGIWIFQVIHEPEKKVDFMPGGGGGGQRGAETKVQQKKQKQITPSTSVKRVFVEGAKSNFAIPDPGDTFGEMSSLSSLAGGGMTGGLGGSGSGGGFGSGKGTGSGFGDGKGVGKLFGLIPETMRKRCSKEDRLERLKANGGTPACDDAVSKSLRYFKSTQAADGSWGNNVAMTGLVLLAYFGHCETPISPEFGESSMKAIAFLVNTAMKNNGKLANNFTDKHWPYEHSIGTYALGEAATFCQDLKISVPSLMEMTEKAGQYIIDNQNVTGGWAYFYDLKKDGHSDVSVTAWHLQALKACSHTDIKFKGMDLAVSKGLGYINDLQDKKTGGIGYESIGTPIGQAEGYCTLTGAGVLANQMWGKSNRSEVTKGLDYILENTKFEYNTKFADLYGHYYESQAMMQAGGKHWEKYNGFFRDQLLNNQEADGSWKMPGGGQKIRGSDHELGNKVYRTALCTLMLEVYYRFLSTDQGSTIQRGPRKI